MRRHEFLASAAAALAACHVVIERDQSGQPHAAPASGRHSVREKYYFARGPQLVNRARAGRRERARLRASLAAKKPRIKRHAAPLFNRID